MRKLKKGKKFSRKRDQRRALLRNLSVELFSHGRIKTTEAKAKELRRFAEKFITTAKKGDLASRRRLLKFLPKKTVQKLFQEIAPRYAERKGGYTRIIKLEPRRSDSSKMALIELIK